jgi:hypothetical protein
MVALECLAANRGRILVPEIATELHKAEALQSNENVNQLLEALTDPRRSLQLRLGRTMGKGVALPVQVLHNWDYGDVDNFSSDESHAAQVGLAQEPFERHETRIDTLGQKIRKLRRAFDWLVAMPVFTNGEGVQDIDDGFPRVAQKVKPLNLVLGPVLESMKVVGDRGRELVQHDLLDLVAKLGYKVRSCSAVSVETESMESEAWAELETEDA